MILHLIVFLQLLILRLDVVKLKKSDTTRALSHYGHLPSGCRGKPLWFQVTKQTPVYGVRYVRYGPQPASTKSTGTLEEDVWRIGH